jgi:hypothetical protein
MAHPRGWTRCRVKRARHSNKGFAEQHFCFVRSETSFAANPTPFKIGRIYRPKDHRQVYERMHCRRHVSAKEVCATAPGELDGALSSSVTISLSLWAHPKDCCNHSVSPKNGQSHPAETFFDSGECRISTQCPTNAIGMAVAFAAPVCRRTQFQGLSAGETRQQSNAMQNQK